MFRDVSDVCDTSALVKIVIVACDNTERVVEIQAAVVGLRQTGE